MGRRHTASRRWAFLGVPLFLAFGGCEIRFGSGGPESSCSCELDGADAECSRSGECRIVRCHPLRGDCNDDARDGCETFLTNFVHCGACGSFCPEAANDCRDAICSRDPVRLAGGVWSRSVPLTIDDGYVYFAAGTEQVNVLRVSKRATDAEATLLSPAARVAALSVDDESLYWLELSPPWAPEGFEIKRLAKDGSGGVSVLAAGAGIPDRRLVRSGAYFYLDVLLDTERLVRVSVETGEVAAVPGWEHPGVIYGLTAQGEHVVFGFSGDHGEPGDLLVEYQPAEERFAVLDERFLFLPFAVDGENVYFREPAPGGPGIGGYALMRRRRGTTMVEYLGRSNMDFQHMVLDGGSLFLVNVERGALSRLDFSTGETRVLCGEQFGLTNVALDPDSVFFAGSGFVWRLPR